MKLDFDRLWEGRISTAVCDAENKFAFLSVSFPSHEKGGLLVHSIVGPPTEKETKNGPLLVRSVMNGNSKSTASGHKPTTTNMFISSILLHRHRSTFKFMRHANRGLRAKFGVLRTGKDPLELVKGLQHGPKTETAQHRDFKHNKEWRIHISGNSPGSRSALEFVGITNPQLDCESPLNVLCCRVGLESQFQHKRNPILPNHSCSTIILSISSKHIRDESVLEHIVEIIVRALCNAYDVDRAQDSLTQLTSLGVLISVLTARIHICEQSKKKNQTIASNILLHRLYGVNFEYRPDTALAYAEGACHTKQDSRKYRRGGEAGNVLGKIASGHNSELAQAAKGHIIMFEHKCRCPAHDSIVGWEASGTLENEVIAICLKHNIVEENEQHLVLLAIKHSRGLRETWKKRREMTYNIVKACNFAYFDKDEIPLLSKERRLQIMAMESQAESAATEAVSDKQEDKAPVPIWGPYVFNPITGRLHGPRPTTHHENYSYMQRAWHEYEFGIPPPSPPLVEEPMTEEEIVAFLDECSPHRFLLHFDTDGRKKQR